MIPDPTTEPLQEVKLCRMTAATFLDQIDAATPEILFWHSLQPKDAPVSMDSHPHRGEGGSTTAIYSGAALLGLTITMRDELNRTVLICLDTRATPESEDAKRLDWLDSHEIQRHWHLAYLGTKAGRSAREAIDAAMRSTKGA